MDRLNRDYRRGPILRQPEGITIHLMGGIGNQMFQYAMGRYSAMRLNVPLKLHIGSFTHDRMRMYSLGLWRNIMAGTTLVYSGLIINEIGMPYNPEVVASITKHCTLHGYWQTEKYFHEIRPLLHAEFLPGKLTPTSEAALDKIRSEGNKSVFLTIRRTDYTQSSYHGVLPFDYYLQACKMIANEVMDPHFFIFSDEPEWVTENFKLPYRTTVAGTFDRTVAGHLGREDEDLYLMSQCHHAVMANSSYSWWGAWLNDDDDPKIVIAPKQWFLNSPEDPRDIIPERWIKI